MIKRVLTQLEKEAIVAEYLMGSITYRQLGKKYDVDYRIIHSWVMKFKGLASPKTPLQATQIQPLKPLPELLLLQEQLRLEKLRNELLNAIIDIADKELKINIKKKFGTKQ
jgi:transposase